MTDHKLESAAKTVYHEGQDKVEPYVNLTSRGREILGDDDRMFAAEDIIQLIENRIEELSSEIDEIEQKMIDSECELSGKDGATLRKWRCKRIEEFENLKSSLEVED